MLTIPSEDCFADSAPGGTHCVCCSESWRFGIISLIHSTLSKVDIPVLLFLLHLFVGMLYQEKQPLPNHLAIQWSCLPFEGPPWTPALYFTKLQNKQPPGVLPRWTVRIAEDTVMNDESGALQTAAALPPLTLFATFRR